MVNACGTCKYENLDIDHYICRDCRDFKSWQPKDIEIKKTREVNGTIIRECCTCKHEDLDFEDEPCDECINSDAYNLNWELRDSDDEKIKELEERISKLENFDSDNNQVEIEILRRENVNLRAKNKALRLYITQLFDTLGTFIENRKDLLED